jgi:S-ribosylhomocysteine lyase LuxS involved in autoinducer biosynthesis
LSKKKKEDLIFLFSLAFVQPSQLKNSQQILHTLNHTQKSLWCNKSLQLSIKLCSPWHANGMDDMPKAWKKICGVEWWNKKEGR